MSIDLEKAVEAFQLAELEYRQRMSERGVLFDPALGVEAGLIAALPHLRNLAIEDARMAEVCRSAVIDFMRDTNKIGLFCAAEILAHRLKAEAAAASPQDGSAS